MLVILLITLSFFADCYSTDYKKYKNNEVINFYVNDYLEIKNKIIYVEDILTDHDINNVFFYVSNRKINLVYAAAIVNDEKNLERFIELGANINIKDDKGRTPLMNAIIDENYNAIYLLLSLGANCQIKDIYKRDFFDYASSRFLVFENLRNKKMSNQDLINIFKQKNLSKRDLQDTNRYCCF